jgi:uncharacterized protein (TIGR01777 family)
VRATVTGATGLIGSRLLPALVRENFDVTVLSRSPERARAQLAHGVALAAWDPVGEPAPAAALEGRDAVIHLAGATVARRWSARARREIRDSRVRGTEHLVQGLAALRERPRVLVCSSATGYYGAAGEEPLDEDARPGNDFLAQVCVDWEAQARRAADLGMRVVHVRTGMVLDRRGGALARMLTPFKLGLGGPIAGGRQFTSWIHHEDLVALILTALGDERFGGAINATAPEPVTNREFARRLGRVLHRPALMPLPAPVLRAIFGEMSTILTTGARAVPAKALVLGFGFRHPQLEQALRSALADG